MRNLRVRDFAMNTPGKKRAVEKLKSALRRYGEVLKQIKKVDANREIRELSTLRELIRTVDPETEQGISFNLFISEGEDPKLRLPFEKIEKGESATKVLFTNLCIVNARIDDIERSGHETNSRVNRALENIRSKRSKLAETINELEYRFGSKTLMIGIVGGIISMVAAMEKFWIIACISAAAALVVGGTTEIRRMFRNKREVEQLLSENHEEFCSSMERALSADACVHESRVIRASEGVVEMIETLLPMAPLEVAEGVRARIYSIPRY